MRQFLQKSIFPVLVCLVFILTMALPAAAADDDAVISLSEPSKIFNDDGTVTVIYDLPLDPYSKIYGLPVGKTEFVQVGTSTNIYFTQDKDESITVFTALSSGSVSSTTSGSSGNGRVWTSASIEPFSFDVDAVTHLLVNGVAYSVQPYSDDNYYMRYDTNPSAGSDWTGRYCLYTVLGPNASSGKWAWSFMSQSRIDASLAVGYYEDVMISQHEYDELYPLLYPFGRSNYIDVSNIRSGGSFEVSVTYDYNIQLTGTDTTTNLIQHIDFYDKDWRLISTTSSVTTPFDVENGASSTIKTMVTVPEGACYMDMELITDPFAVSDVQLLDWRVSDMEMTLDMSDVEANSLMMSGIIDRLDILIQEAKEQNASLDEIIQLLQDVIDNMGSAGSDQTEIKDLLEQLLEQQQQNGEQLTPTPEQSDKAEDLENDIRDEAASIENNNSMLDQLTPSRPVINTDLTLDPVFLASASPLIANIWSISGMGRIIGVVLAVATVAYIFFGKRDG